MITNIQWTLHEPSLCQVVELVRVASSGRPVAQHHALCNLVKEGWSQ